MNYKNYKVSVIWENNTEIDFIISGVDSNSVGQIVSKLEGIKEIKNIKLATKEEIDLDNIKIQK